MTLDLILIGCVVVWMIIGFISGFWVQMLRLGVLVGAYFLAGLVARPLGTWLFLNLKVPPLVGSIIAPAVAFLLLYMILAAVAWSIVRAARRLRSATGEQRSRLNSWGGALLGGVKMVLILGVLLSAVALAREPLEKVSKKSVLEKLALDDSKIFALVKKHNLLAQFHLPVVGDIATLTKLSTDPKMAEKVANDPQIKALISHPKIKALLNDPTIIKASETRDIAALLANPRINELANDLELQQLIRDVDLSKLK
jgi:uncharacterized membrane protein required for colicin V production